MRVGSAPVLSLLAVLALPGLTAEAADRNGYTASYECRAGAPFCDVDVAALAARPCEQTISPSTSPTHDWSAIDWSKQVICVAPGDHTRRGTLTLGASGSSGAYRVLRYHGSGSGDPPWKQSRSDRAILWRIDTSGRDNWLIDRLAFEVRGSNYAVQVRNGSTNVIMNRIYATGGGYPYAGMVTFWGASNSTLQNSVLGACRVEPSSESYAVQLVRDASDVRLVNNELFDCTKTLFVNESPSDGAPGLVLENNDFYFSPAFYTDCRGNFTPGGPCSGGEAVINFKQGGSQAKPLRIVHNRLWGARPLDANISGDSGGAEGPLIATSVGTSGTHQPFSGSDWFLIQNNVLFDAQQGLVATGFNTPTRLDNHSVIGNIIWDIRTYASRFGTHALIWNFRRANEFYLNTVIGSRGHSINNWNAWLTTSDTDRDSDLRCNVVIDSDGRRGQPGSGTIYDDNAYYGTSPSGEADNIARGIHTRSSSAAYHAGDVMRTTTNSAACNSLDDAACFLYQAVQAGTTAGTPPAPCTTLGCTYNDGSVVWSAVRGPFAFMRKLHTGPEQVVVPYVLPHRSAIEAFGCPADYASRGGIGIDDTR